MQTRDSLDEGIRTRLRSLLERYPQAEIARRCNTTPSNVSRYLRDTKIPAELCAAAVGGLGVNPAWLLSGQGAPMLADVSASTAELGKGVLQLVDAMNAVTRVRLGALAGKQHAQTLRDLNEALVLYEKLKQQLSKRSRETFLQLLGDLGKAVEKSDWKRYDQLMGACEQISRLSEDNDLKMELLSMKAYSEMLRGNALRAAQTQRQVFAGLLADSSGFNLAAFDHAKRLGLALEWIGRTEEAIGVWKAAIALAGRAGRKWLTYRMTKFMIAAAQARSGRLRRGIYGMQKTWPHLPPERQAQLAHVLAFDLLMAGTIGMDEALAMSKPSHLARETLGVFALWLEDAREMRRVAEMETTQAQVLPEEDRLWQQYLLALAEVVEGKPADKARSINTSWPISEGGLEQKAIHELVQRIYLAQLERLAGRQTEAWKLVAANEQSIREWPKGRRFEALAQGIHYRTVCKLADAGSPAAEQKAMHQRALTFFARMFKRGYGCFREFVPDAIAPRATLTDAYSRK